MKQKAST